jgi:hypothetical protein
LPSVLETRLRLPLPSPFAFLFVFLRVENHLLSSTSSPASTILILYNNNHTAYQSIALRRPFKVQPVLSRPLAKVNLIQRH